MRIKTAESNVNICGMATSFGLPLNSGRMHLGMYFFYLFIIMRFISILLILLLAFGCRPPNPQIVKGKKEKVGVSLICLTLVVLVLTSSRLGRCRRRCRDKMKQMNLVLM